MLDLTRGPIPDGNKAGSKAGGRFLDVYSYFIVQKERRIHSGKSFQDFQRDF